MKLGIVGHGFVGTAVDHGFTRDVQKFIVDPKHNSTNTIEDLIAFKPNATFVSVPTPMLETGECNTAILEDVMQQLNQCKGLLVIVKSTVPAYKLQAIQEQCVDLRIVYNPEFLTEKNYIEDFRNPPMHVFGGVGADTDAVEKLYKEHSECAECPVYKTDIVTASMVKYCINSFLATKVTFMNEMYDVLKAARGTDWNTFLKSRVVTASSFPSFSKAPVDHRNWTCGLFSPLAAGKSKVRDATLHGSFSRINSSTSDLK